MKHIATAAGQMTLSDVVFTVLILFVVAASQVGVNAQKLSEYTLPPIDLSTGRQVGGAGMTMDRRMILTLKPDTSEKFSVYVADKKIAITDLAPELKKTKPIEVILRVDNSITHGQEMEIITICEENGVGQVSFAVKDKKNQNRAGGKS